MNYEIYPCPECGGSGKIVYVGDRNLRPVVRCKDCGYTEDSYFGFDLESTAIQFWNKRVEYRKWKRNCLKQVPQKVAKTPYFYGYIYGCPCCDNFISSTKNSTIKYCNHCGQALDWSET